MIAVEQVVALYNYQAQNNDELTFAKNSVINVIENKVVVGIVTMCVCVKINDDLSIAKSSLMHECILRMMTVQPLLTSLLISCV